MLKRGDRVRYTGGNYPWEINGKGTVIDETDYAGCCFVKFDGEKCEIAVPRNYLEKIDD